MLGLIIYFLYIILLFVVYFVDNGDDYVDLFICNFSCCPVNEMNQLKTHKSYNIISRCVDVIKSNHSCLVILMGNETVIYI